MISQDDQNRQNQEYLENENPNEITETPKGVEVYKEVERFKLGIWLAKVFSLFLLIVVTFFISIYGYVAVTTAVLGDLAGLGSLLSGFFEVIKVVLVP
jgi:hypothetical protein